LEYDVHEAGSPDACLELIDSQKIQLDLIVTDIIMPGGNGVELFLKLKDRSNHPIVFCLAL
jgi:CheY-like chemotaxis protein